MPKEIKDKSIKEPKGFSRVATRKLLLDEWNRLLNGRTAVYYGLLQWDADPTEESIDEWERRSLNLIVDLTELQERTAIFLRKTL